VTTGATDTTLHWYLQSLGDADTHHGRMSPDGLVLALRGAQFAPRPSPVTGPQPFLDHFAATVLVRELVKLADQAPTLTDNELRALLAALAGWLR
jgi:hypothetical protein